MHRSDPGRRQTDQLGRDGLEVPHDPPTASDFLQLCLSSLQDLVQSLSPSASEVS
jgi:hypothetical protein